MVYYVGSAPLSIVTPRYRGRSDGTPAIERREALERRIAALKSSMDLLEKMSDKVSKIAEESRKSKADEGK